MRVSPVIREDGSGSNTYNIEAISSSDSDTTDSDTSDENANQTSSQPPNQRSDVSLNTTNEDDHGMEEEYADLETLSDDDSSSSSSTSTSMNNDEPLAGFSPSLEPVNAASWNSSSNDTNSDETVANVIQNDNHDEI